MRLFRGLTRVFVSPDSVNGETAELDEPLARHLVRVLRKREGDQIIVLDGEGKGWVGALQACSKAGATARLLDVLSDPDAGMRHVEVALPPLKGERMDFALQKCTEIGASVFHVVAMERCVARLGGDGKAKAERLGAVVRAAAEQCGAFRIPELRIWADLAQFLSQVRPSERYIAWEEHLGGLPAGLAGSGEPCILASGPEGGLSAGEMEIWKRAGFQPVGLGRRVLRAETAPMVMTALALCANFSP